MGLSKPQAPAAKCVQCHGRGELCVSCGGPYVGIWSCKCPRGGKPANCPDCAGTGLAKAGEAGS